VVVVVVHVAMEVSILVAQVVRVVAVLVGE
jgi:hypothetical protein